MPAVQPAKVQIPIPTTAAPASEARGLCVPAGFQLAGFRLTRQNASPSQDCERERERDGVRVRSDIVPRLKVLALSFASLPTWPVSSTDWQASSATSTAVALHLSDLKAHLQSPTECKQ